MVLSKLKTWFGGGSSRVNVRERFDIKGKSGMGSMSQVYRAYDRQLQRPVCLKLLDKDKTAKFEARFAGLNKPGEGEISVQLQHPNLVETIEHGWTTTGEQFLLMEWLDGTGLHSLIEGQHHDLEGNRNGILAQVAAGLEYMHQQKYLHRDICPRNVVVLPSGKVKLIDFGLTIPYRPEFCKPGNRTGTPQYLAPEVLKRQPTDHRIDIFSLGVTAYETFTGQLPWGPFESVNNQMAAMGRPGTDPREHVADMDVETADFLMKAIDRDPGRRFQTAAMFRQAILNLKWKW
jgi:serine/threonine protein kinase